jgi:hypothetical protein
MKIVCNYAPLRFLPYRDTGEFVNVGVVVHCPQTGQFDFKLAPVKKTKRISGFFPGLNVEVFEAALNGAKRELERIQAEHAVSTSSRNITPETSKAQMERFAALVSRREGLLFFGEAGALLSENAKDAMDLLYKRFIERQFADDSQEQVGATTDLAHG